MRIAQVAPLWEQVPPVGYGGIELIVSLLTEELVQRGHEVTLFASGDSTTSATLESVCDEALRPSGILPFEEMVYEQMQLSNLFQRANDFDIIHCHVDDLALPYGSLTKTPVVHTTHHVFRPLMRKIFSQHRRQNYVSISLAHQQRDLGLNYVANVYNAIAVDQFTFAPTPQDPPYLFFLGRLSPQKGPHLAIEIAKRTGWKLKIAGMVNFSNQEFFEKEVEPYIDGEQIEFLGEIGHTRKVELLKGATATLFPITWPEPFGLVMVESMACGTPVIAMANGAAPEVITDGETGVLCETVDDCVAAVAKISHIDRLACRTRVETHFSTERMVDGYEAVYQKLIQDRFTHNGHTTLRLPIAN